MNQQPATHPAFPAIDGEIATLTLNRPESYNAIDLAMATRLRDLARDVEADGRIKILVVRGEGPAFCGGGDIRHFVENLDDFGSCLRDLLTPYPDFLLTFRPMPKVLLSSVPGAAAGTRSSRAQLFVRCTAGHRAL